MMVECTEMRVSISPEKLPCWNLTAAPGQIPTTIWEGSELDGAIGHHRLPLGTTPQQGQLTSTDLSSWLWDPNRLIKRVIYQIEIRRI